MGGGMGYQNPMKNIFMMEAMTGGDMFQNDFAKDLGGMMMLNNMMRPQMGMYGAYAYPYQYYQHPATAVTTTTTQPAATTPNSGYASRIQNGKRGGFYDNYFEMNMLQNWLNPQGQVPATGAGATAGAPAGQFGAGMDPSTLAYMEMALGDAATDPAATPADPTLSDQSATTATDAKASDTTPIDSTTG